VRRSNSRSPRDRRTERQAWRQGAHVAAPPGACAAGHGAADPPAAGRGAAAGADGVPSLAAPAHSRAA
jgi:hypothetical protein